MAEQNKVVQGAVSLVVGAGLLWFFFGGGLEKQAAKDMGRIHDQVANDSVEQYNMTKRSGTAIDVCVHAGLVSAAYLQAKDEPNYQRWKQIEKADCQAAGVPQ